VPVEYLKDLAAELQQNKNPTSGGGWQKVIRDRLVVNQERFVDELVAQETWTKRQIGRVLVPGEISDEFKCWGQSADNREYWIKYAYSTCSTEDAIFISSTMFTGQFSFRYTWLESREFNPFRFYNLFQKHVGEENLYYFENAKERDVENFSCENSFVRIDGKVFQSSFCARPYDEYEGIYDLNLKLSSVAFYSDALAIDIIALGVTQQQTQKFLERFLKEIEWQE
ncbi:MAG TPA: hypothetical protein VLJ10_05730, partial [Candidatus Bathyarchaeia archaeon]|nr:hypothetical protein [Candidatus Bathyarchaeia archaeon]